MSKNVRAIWQRRALHAAALRRTGMSWGDIGKMLGMDTNNTRRSVYRVAPELRRLIPSDHQYRKLTNERALALITDYATSGKYLKQLAHDHGVSVAGIYQYLRREKVPLRQPRYRKIRDQKGDWIRHGYDMEVLK